MSAGLSIGTGTTEKPNALGGVASKSLTHKCRARVARRVEHAHAGDPRAYLPQQLESLVLRIVGSIGEARDIG